MSDGPLQWLAIAALVVGTFFAALGALGLLRMPDPYTRIQAASKSGTLGAALVFVAVGLHLGDLASLTKALAIIAFMFLSIPISAHMIARAAHASGLPVSEPDDADELREHQSRDKR